MELRHLRYFNAVAEARSFTLAARRLNVSQSGVSGQVRELERELGVELFRRGQHEVRLTPEGAVFGLEAKEILLRAERAMQLARRASQGDEGKLTIGLCGPVTALFLPRLVRRFRRQFPGVALALRERQPSEQALALLEASIDVGFTRSVSVENKHLIDSQRLFREPVVAALPKGHDLIAEGGIAVSALATSRLVLYYRDGAPEIFDAVMALCHKAKFQPRISDTPQSWQAVLTMVEAGEGVALVPSCVQNLRANDVVFRPLLGRGVQLDAVAIWRRNETNPVVARFLEMLQTVRQVHPVAIKSA